MRVLMCDDSAVMRRVIRQILESMPNVEVVAVARNGKECLDLAKQHHPDLITLDIEMPIMDGLTALRHIMAECPTNVVMVSSLTTKGSREAIKALRLGAADVVAKDHANFTSNAEALREQITTRVDALRHANRPVAVAHQESDAPTAPAIRTAPACPLTQPPPAITRTPRIVVIGSSTGGPPVLEHILSRVHAKTNAAIVVAQHMPAVFTKSMAEHLNNTCSVPVVHLDPGVPAEAGRIHIAPGGLNTHIKPTPHPPFHVRIDRDPPQTVYFPSATALFISAAKATAADTLGIILTGMGTDGKEGVAALVDSGATVLAQDENSCVVYGMPKAAADAGARAATPDQIRDALAVATKPNAAAA